MYCRIMKWVWLLAVMGEMRWASSTVPDEGKYTEEKGRSFMEQLNKESAIWANRLANAGWDYNSNLTDYNLQVEVRPLNLLD